MRIIGFTFLGVSFVLAGVGAFLSSTSSDFLNSRHAAAALVCLIGGLIAFRYDSIVAFIKENLLLKWPYRHVKTKAAANLTRILNEQASKSEAKSPLPTGEAAQRNQAVREFNLSMQTATANHRRERNLFPVLGFIATLLSFVGWSMVAGSVGLIFLTLSMQDQQTGREGLSAFLLIPILAGEFAFGVSGLLTAAAGESIDVILKIEKNTRPKDD